MMVAAMLLNAGEADAVLAVGGESILCPIVVSGLSQAKALSRCNDDPLHACRPFDLNRDGFVIGEGGGALLIETEEHAPRARRNDSRGAGRLGQHIGCTPCHGALPGWCGCCGLHEARAAARRDAALRHRIYQCARYLDAARRQG